MTSDPVTPDEQSVREHLAKILNTGRFKRAEQQSQLLRFIVECSLAHIEFKERTIGEEIYGKKADYNTDDFSMVRTYATRLRERLNDYYAGEGRDDALRIEIAKRSYVASYYFVKTAADAPSATTEPTAILTPTSVGVEVAPEPIFAVENAPAGNADRVVTAPAELAHGRSHWAWAIGVVVVVAAAMVGTLVSENSNAHLRVVASKALTHDGREKGGPLFTDGINVYFLEGMSLRDLAIASIPVNGGNIYHVPINLREPIHILGALDGPSAFLLFGRDAQNQSRFWRWEPNQRLEPLEPASESAVRISDFIQADAEDGHLRIRQSGRPDRWIPIPGIVKHLSWQGDRRLLRFSVFDQGRGTSSLWEMKGIDGRPAPLPGYAENSFEGRWNVAGTLYTFIATDTGHFGRDVGDVWIVDYRRSAYGKRPMPTRLTEGPISYVSPAASPDGSHVFAIGYAQKAELVAYDARRQEWLPYLGGMSAFETDFSRDGQWIAYVRYPERTLWKVRRDGSENTQLTFPPFEAIQPQWSPDGQQIAVMGQKPGGHHRIYLIPSSVGQARELTTEPADQGIPTWSADGSKLVFGELLSERNSAAMSIHVLDVKSPHQQTLQGSSGMWTPRWSPNGRWIAALTADSKTLRLYDTQTGQWRTLAEFPFIESPAWTEDSTQIYFRSDSTGIDAKHTRVMQRIDIRNAKVAQVADLSDVQVSDTGWYGLTREGIPLTLRSIRTTDIYSITVPK